MIAALAADAPGDHGGGHGARWASGADWGRGGDRLECFQPGRVARACGRPRGEIALHRRVACSKASWRSGSPDGRRRWWRGYSRPRRAGPRAGCARPVPADPRGQHDRLGARASAGLGRWMTSAIEEEELELVPAIHPHRGGARDAVIRRGRGGRCRRRECRDGAGRAPRSAPPCVPEIVVGGAGPGRGDELSERRRGGVPRPPRKRRRDAQHGDEQQRAQRRRRVAAPGTIVVSAVSQPTTLVVVWYFGLTAFALGSRMSVVGCVAARAR